jgi:hypothetical protein
MLSLPKYQSQTFMLSLPKHQPLKAKLILPSQPSKLQRRRSIRQSSIRTAEGRSEANPPICNLKSAIFTAKAAAELICNPYVKTPTSNYSFHSIFRIPLTVN